MNDTVYKLWPELEWIKDDSLREKTAKTWETALVKSVLMADEHDTCLLYTSPGP